MSKVAIVFWSATGNTETMANCIAEGAGANGTIVPCAEMTPAKLAEFDVVAFGCPAMGCRAAGGERVRAYVCCTGRLAERQKDRTVRLLRLG